ncbi:retrovirus-related pol polyprotein from transposon TNT 1-94 [Tanacetum coccineum]
MSNSNINLQTQSSNALHNAIMEAGSKDRPPMLAPGNYVQWKSRIKRYIDTKPNSELIHYCLQNPPYTYQWAEKTVPVAEGSSETTTERYMENYKNVSQDIRDQLNAEAEAVQIILTGIDNDIYSTVDACPNACEMWKAIERLKQGESINVQDLETNLYWEFGKFTSRDGESLESYYSRFYKMMNELVRNQCHVTNHQVNVQFLLQLQPEWQRFVTLVKQSQELKTVSYHKLYDILKQHQNEVNEIRAERLARTANPLALVAQQQPVYHHQNHPTQNTQYSSTRSQQSTRNRGKAIVTSSAPTYDPEPATVTEDEEMSKEKEIDKLMALISLSFKKIYKPTNNNLRTSSNTSRANQDNSPRINRGTGYDNQRAVNVVGARENVGTPVVQKSGIQCYNCKEYGHVSRECQKPKRVKDAAYHKEKMLLCKQEEAEVRLNAEQAYWKDDTDDESDDQELEAHYMYMAQIQEVTPDPVDNSGPIFDEWEPMHKDDQDNTDDLDQERDLLASLIQKLKCEIDDNKNRNKFLESSNKALVDKLKGEIEDFKAKNKTLESSNNHFKEANNELSKTNQLMFKDLKKFQAELDKYNDVNYASKVEIDCAKAKGDLMSYKIDFEKSSNEYTRKINDLNQTISDIKKELCAHQETISIMSQAKEAQIKLYKTREDKELDKVIALENKVKVLNDIVYKTGQSIQTMNMLNRNCKTSFAKPEFLKKAQSVNPLLYDIGCYNDNLALMLAPDSDETIRLDKERRSKLSDLIRPFDYDQLNNLYDLFVPQWEKSAEQYYFPKPSNKSHTSSNNEFSKESFRKQPTLFEKRMDESIPWDQKCKSSKELFKIKKSVDTIFDGVERCKQTITKRTYFGNIDPFIQNIIEGNFCPQIRRFNADLEKFHLCLNEEMVADLRYFNSLEHEVDTLKSQLETQKTQFLNEIDRLSREYYYADHMNAILGVYTDLDEVTNLQCDYLETLEKCEHLEKELSKSRTMSKSFEALQKHAINLELDLQQCKEKIKNDKSFKENQSNVFLKEREQYVEIQDLKAQLQDKGIAIRVIPTTSVSRPQLKSNQLEDRVMPNNSQGKKQNVEDHRRNFKFSNNKTFVTACNDSLNAKTSNVNFVCVTCGKCVLNDNHDLCVLHYINGVSSRTRQPIVVPISTREPKHNVNQSVATSSKKTVATDSTVKKSRNITRKLYEQLVEIILFIVDSGCSKHMTGNLKLLTNFVEKFLGTVKFGNDQIAPILGYGDLVQGTITIKRVYYVEGLNHNLFSVGQFCDADLEVAFRKSTCYIRDLKGNDLLTGSRGTDLYSITLQDSTTPNPICLMAKATSSQAWLWHRRLSHLNFDTINLLSKNNIVNGLPKLKFVKDHLCSSCELRKAKKKEIGSQSIECDHLNEIGMVVRLVEFISFTFGDKEMILSKNCFSDRNNNCANTPILTLPDGVEDFVVYCDASNQGLGCVLMQRGKVIDYASRQLKIHEKNYTDADFRIWGGVFLLRLRGIICMTGMREKIQAAQGEAFKQENILAERLAAVIPNSIKKLLIPTTTAKAMWQKVEHKMRGTVQNQIDRETRFNNEFDQFVAEPGEALVSVYNHFAQLMNDLERNHIIFPKVSINTKFLNCLQHEWMKYKLVNASRAKKLEKSHDPLALVAHTRSLSRTSSPYYVTHPSLVVEYVDDYQGDTLQNNSDDPLTYAMILLARVITRCDNHDLSRLVKLLVLTYVSVAMNGLCDYMCLYAFMWIILEIGSQSIECGHLNEIGMVVRLVEFISFTFGDKEMIL